MTSETLDILAWQDTNSTQEEENSLYEEIENKLPETHKKDK